MTRYVWWCSGSVERWREKSSRGSCTRLMTLIKRPIHRPAIFFSCFARIVWFLSRIRRKHRERQRNSEELMVRRLQIIIDILMILIAPIFEGRVIKRVLIFRSPPFPPRPPGPDMKIIFGADSIPKRMYINYDLYLYTTWGRCWQKTSNR